MAEDTKKQAWKYQITNSSRIEEKEFKAAAKRFKQHAFDLDMTPDELFVQMVRALPPNK